MNAFFGVLFMIGMVVLFYYSMRRAIRRDNYINHLVIEFYDEMRMKQPELIEEMYKYCTSDFKLKKIVEKYDATPETFTKIFEKLIYWGNVKKRKRYVPIYSFFYASSLEYILKHQDDDAKSITMKMMNHFHI